MSEIGQAGTRSDIKDVLMSCENNPACLTFPDDYEPTGSRWVKGTFNSARSVHRSHHTLECLLQDTLACQLERRTAHGMLPV